MVRMVRDLLQHLNSSLYVIVPSAGQAQKRTVCMCVFTRNELPPCHGCCFVRFIFNEGKASVLALICGARIHDDIPYTIRHLTHRYTHTYKEKKINSNKLRQFPHLSQPLRARGCVRTFLISSRISSFLLSLGMEPIKRRQLSRLTHTPMSFPGRTSKLSNMAIALWASSLHQWTTQPTRGQSLQQ